MITAFTFWKGLKIMAISGTIFWNMKARPSVNGGPPHKYGATIVRVWAGQHEDAPDMTGHQPDMATYTVNGQKIGEWHGDGKRVAAGGFIDAMISNGKDFERVDPDYLKIYAGGSDGLCVSAIALLTPSGQKRAWTADTLIDCNHPLISDLKYEGQKRIGYMDSRTQIGNKGEQPRCVWLDRNKSWGLQLKEIDLHIPDMIATPEKQAAWNETRGLICHESPRQMPRTDDAWKAKAFRKPIWVFDPALQYELETRIDKEPTRILEWTYPTTGFHLRVTNGSEEVEDHTPVFDSSDTSPSNDSDNKIPPIHHDVRQIPPTERILVISSNDTMSATHQCSLTAESSEKYDYLSLDEGVYCDRHLKTMYPVCSDVITILCFDTAENMLRRFHPSAAVSITTATTTIGTSNATNTVKRRDIWERHEDFLIDLHDAKESGIPITYTSDMLRPLWGRPYTNANLKDAEEIVAELQMKERRAQSWTA